MPKTNTPAKTTASKTEIILPTPPKDRRVGWSIKSYAEAIDTSVANVYLLLARKVVRGKKLGRKTIITHPPPRDLLASLPDWTPSGPVARKSA